MRRSLAPARLLVCAALIFNALTSAAPARQQQQPASQQPSPPTDRQRPQPPSPARETPQEIGDEEVLSLNTDLVQLRAVVTDKRGELVDNLTRDDFEVFEDGRAQQVSFFSVERAGGAGEGPADAPSKRQPPARVVVLFVDTLHMAPVNLFRAKHYLRKFVDEIMTDRDSVMVVSTSGTLGVLQQFTSNRRMLRYAIDRLTPFLHESTAFTPDLSVAILNGSEDAVNLALIILHDEENYTPPTREAAVAYVEARAREMLHVATNLRDGTLDTLAAVGEMLSRMKGQRLIAFVSNGFSMADANGTINADEFNRVVGRIARAGVVVYSLLALGLSAGGHPALGVASGMGMSGMAALAEQTGGEAFFKSNFLDLSLRRMLDANRLYYSLAYYPPKGGDDKRYRKLSVRVKGHPEYNVRVQRGYVPAERRAEDLAKLSPREKLFKQIVAPLPVTNIGVTSSADYLELASDDAQVTLQVHLDGDRLEYEREGAGHRLRCELVSVVFDHEGKIADHASETVSALLDDAQLAAARRDGYRYTKRLKLKPGLYQVRVGVREPASGLTGTSSSWIDVPDLSRSKLAVSSLFLGQSAAGGEGTDSQKDAAHRVAPKLAVGPVSVKSGESVFYRFVVYRAAGARGDASVKVEVVQGEKDFYTGEFQPLSARAVRADARGTEAGGQLRLPLPPGVYTLRVTIRDPATRKSVETEADFEIVS